MASNERWANRREALVGLLGAAAGTAPWPEAVTHLQQARVERHDFGDVTVFDNRATSQLKSMVAGSLLLKAGHEPHPPHQHPEEEFMLVTEGEGEFFSDGKWTAASPGTLLYSEGNHLHGVRNTGKEPMRFYYFKWLA